MRWLRRLFAALKERAYPVWERPEAGVSPHSGWIDLPVETPKPEKKPRKTTKKKRAAKK